MKYFLIILFIFCGLAGKSQVDILSTFKRLPVNLSWETACDEKQEIKRKDSNIVVFSFFQDISDTIIIFVNGKEMKRSFLLHDSVLVSTDYTGFDFSYNFKEIKNTITIAYVNSGSFIEFELDKGFPLYSIHFYTTGYYYVSGRKCFLVIK